MERKTRRSPGAAGPIAGPDESMRPLEVRAAAAGPSVPPELAALLADAAEGAETALDVVTAAETAAALPSIAPFSPAAEPGPPTDRPHLEQNPFAALVQSQAALTRGLGAVSDELARMAFSGIDMAARTATQMLSVKTLSDVIAVNVGFTCSSFDTLVSGSAKLSELGVRLTAEAAQPFLSQRVQH
jgi:Phasin protein